MNSAVYCRGQDFIETAIRGHQDFQLVNDTISELFLKEHTQDTLPTFILGYQQLLEKNKEVLARFSTQDKAEILFRSYLSPIIPLIQNSKKYKTACQSFLKKFIRNLSPPNNALTEESLEKIHSIASQVFERQPEKYIRYLHTDFNGLAIAKALSVNSSEIDLQFSKSQSSLPVLKLDSTALIKHSGV